MIKRVSPGDPLSISASDYNQMATATEQVQSWNRSLTVPNVKGSNSGNLIVTVYNNSDTDIEAFTPVQIVAPLPLINDATALDCNQRPAFQIEAVSGMATDFLITQNKLPAKCIAPALMQGVTVAKVNISNADHQFSYADQTGLISGENGHKILWKESGTGAKWCMLQLGNRNDKEDYQGPWKVEDITPPGGSARIKVYDSVLNNGSLGYMLQMSYKCATGRVPGTSFDAVTGLWAVGSKHLFTTNGTSSYDQTTMNNEFSPGISCVVYLVVHGATTGTYPSPLFTYAGLVDFPYAGDGLSGHSNQFTLPLAYITMKNNKITQIIQIQKHHIMCPFAMIRQ